MLFLILEKIEVGMEVEVFRVKNLCLGGREVKEKVGWK